MDKILRIDVGADGGPKGTIQPVGEYAGLGGRAMTSTVVWNEVPADCHALGPENKLVIAPGLLSGSNAAISGRISVGCKSPLTGTIKESNSGGTAAVALGRLGYAAIIIEGKRVGNDLWKIIIKESGVTFERCNEYKMMTNYPLCERLFNEYGDKISIMSIGTAGEMLMADSTIAVTDPEGRPSRHAGRGGVGAVMGSKGIKCIVIDAEGLKARKPANEELFKSGNKAFVDGLRKHGVTGQGLPAYGTNVLVNIINEAGGFPTYNFSTGRFHGAPKICGETLAAVEAKNPGGQPTHGCHRGCVIRCSGIYTDASGKFISKQPEYETVWGHGAHCGITDLESIVKADYLEDDYGFDTIEMSSTLGVAMEAGVIPFGDVDGMLNLIHEAGKGTPLGRILGAGTETTAKCFGVSRVPTVKGQAIPAYDPRAIQGIGVTYATTTMGADHTAGYAIATNILKCGGDVDPLKPEGQVELSRNLQIATAALDATGFCIFIAFAILDQPETFQAMLDTINGFTGLSLTGDDVVRLGKDILRKEREFNIKAGFGPAHDRLPRFFRTDPIAPHNQTFTVTDEELDSVYNF
jgi:aldehyde:ferredoxin oxidoreductase